MGADGYNRKYDKLLFKPAIRRAYLSEKKNHLKEDSFPSKIQPLPPRMLIYEKETMLLQKEPYLLFIGCTKDTAMDQ